MDLTKQEDDRSEESDDVKSDGNRLQLVVQLKVNLAVYRATSMAVHDLTGLVIPTESRLSRLQAASRRALRVIDQCAAFFRLANLSDTRETLSRAYNSSYADLIDIISNLEGRVSRCAAVSLSEAEQAVRSAMMRAITTVLQLVATLGNMLRASQEQLRASERQGRKELPKLLTRTSSHRRKKTLLSAFCKLDLDAYARLSRECNTSTTFDRLFGQNFPDLSSPVDIVFNPVTGPGQIPGVQAATIERALRVIIESDSLYTDLAVTLLLAYGATISPSTLLSIITSTFLQASHDNLRDEEAEIYAASRGTFYRVR